MRTTAGLILFAAAMMELAGCSGKPSNGALRVTVGFGAKSKAQCVKVSATTASGTVKLSEPVPRAEKSQLVIGIERGGDLTGNVTIEALGYLDAACSDGQLNEHSEQHTADIDKSGVQTVSLTLDGPDPADDADGDGYSKAVDCNDHDAAVHPGQKETFCANGVDDNCAHGTDCADPDCATQPCDDGLSCTQGDVCSGTTCVGVPPNCVNPGLCEQLSGASCGGDGGCTYQAATGQSCGDGGLCRSDKSCAPGNSEVLCDDGIDNDNDGFTDCQDTDCNAQSCDGGHPACVTNFKCNTMACSGDFVTCTPPANSCLTNGQCHEPTGCAFDAGVPGSGCGAADSCTLDGGCVTPESGPVCANGLDDDDDGQIDCFDSSCNGSTCDAGNTCLSGATCNGTTCGGGTTTSCNMLPAECFDVGTCMNGVGCVYPVRTGSCDAGTGSCLPDGGCGYPVVATSPFPYKPSNFDPTLTVGHDAGISINCNAVIDTTAANHFPKWCNDVPDAVVVAMPDGGGDALLVMAASFSLPGGALQITGGLPLIIAITGDATLNQNITVANLDGGLPPGGGAHAPIVPAWCTTGAGGQGHSGSQTSGGGGGGSLGTAGTIAGDGNGGNNNGGGAAGSTSTPSLVPLTGGCPGGNGGDNATNGGYGGGALQISVAGTLTISGGQLGAPGMQGHGGSNAGINVCGGGGGGSGGVLLFEAWSFITSGNPFFSAQGGGGAEAATVGGNNANDNAQPGHTNDTNRANGGQGGSNNGGDGSSAATINQTAIAAQNGQGTPGCGGGGSGGLGLIRVNHYGGTCSAAAGIFSPPITFNTACP